MAAALEQAEKGVEGEREQRAGMAGQLRGALAKVEVLDSENCSANDLINSLQVSNLSYFVSINNHGHGHDLF